MAYTTINKPTEHFNTKLWSGNNTDPTTISGLNFQPDMIWGKSRSGTYSTQDHCINDAVRGANKLLRVNQTNAEETDDNNIKSFTSDGWTMGNDGKINQASTEYVGWSWKANGAGSANTDGDINSTVSANTTSGFSIVSYTGTGANATVGHGLGVAPKMFIVKELSNANSWEVYHASQGAGKNAQLNTTAAFESAGSSRWNSTAPTSSVFSIGTDSGVNTSSSDYIAYCFAEKQGYSKFGSYVGNGSSDGTFIYTGQKSAFVMIKRTSGTGGWFMFDNKRDTFNLTSRSLQADTSGAENNYTAADTMNLDILSNGFKLKSTDGAVNGSGSTYIYMAFAEAPLVGSNNVPCTAR